MALGGQCVVWFRLLENRRMAFAARMAQSAVLCAALSLVAAVQAGETPTDNPRWAFQPVTDPPLPAVRRSDWSHTSIDRFVLAQMEAAGLSPAPPADRASLLRRVTLDLIGLPPAVDDVQRFLADDSPEALAQVVDRLLASPHYGERWGRHWLDVVRYADSDGHEFDPDKPHAWRYRDYVIQALNADVPYDQFVTEHIAGDLLPSPRLSADGRSAASPLGTTFWWLGEVQGAPVDPAMAAANLREQQLDVFGRALLGLTVACARCHEHKFDPISSEDYYALCGFLESTRPVQQSLDATGQRADVAQRLHDLRFVQLELSKGTATARLAHAIESLAKLRDALPRTAGAADLQTAFGKHPELSPWSAEIAAAEDSPQHPLYAWARLRGYSAADGQFAKRRRALAERFAQAAERRPAVEVFASFEDEADEWEAVGPAFAWRAGRDEAEQRLAEGSGCASSGGLADAPVGRLLSPPFVIQKRYIGYLIAGPDRPGKTCVNVLISGQAMPEMQRTGAGGRFRWVTVDVSTMRGRDARLEAVDDDSSVGGFVALDHVCFSDEEPAAPADYRHDLMRRLLADEALDSPEKLAQALVDLFRASLATPAAAPAELEGAALRRWLLYASPLADDFAAREGTLVERPEEMTRLRQRQVALADNWPGSALGLVAADGEGHDAVIQARGLVDVEHRGPPVSRRFLAEIAGPAPLEIASGSGRLELAAAVVSPRNPLLARVMVNRLWQHHFGRGIVATSDNFGELGERPTHPELLDHLATRLVASGWSRKAMHRQIVLSQAYAQGAHGGDDERSARDPQNRLLARMAPRRLEAECVRDALLTLADRLDARLYGASVPMYIEPWMHGRDLPKARGPLDGAGRRSVYLEIRRNFPGPLLSAFDFPQPQTSVGRRQTSLAPTQPLALMNDALVRRLAADWAARLISAESAPRRRIERMFLEAFCRPVGAAECEALERYLAGREKTAAGQNLDSEREAWTAACLAVMNLDEFIVTP